MIDGCSMSLLSMPGRLGSPTAEPDPHLSRSEPGPATEDGQLGTCFEPVAPNGRRPASMRVRKGLDIHADSAPQTRSELHQWIRERMHLPAAYEQALIDAIDNVFMKHEQLWQQSKQEAIQAVSAGFTDRLKRLRDELSARD